MLRSRIATLGALAVVLIAGALALASCGGDDEGGSTETVTLPTATVKTTETETTETTETETTTTTEEERPVVVRITVLGGAPRDGIVRETAKKGDEVVLVVTSDEADEVHVHGYDLYRDLVPGTTARIAFVATLPGRFEIELHHRGTQIGDLTVRP